MALFGRWQTKPPPGTQIDWTNPLTRGLVGCWPMNEGCGTVVHNMAPSVKVNHGTLVNGPAWTSSVYGNSVGVASASSQYIDCGNVAELSGAYQTTLMLLGMRPSGTTYLTAGRANAYSRLFEISVNPNASTLAFLASQTGVTNPYIATVSGNVSIVMVYDSTLSGWPEIAGYIAGQPVSLITSGTIPVHGVALPSTTDPFQFGRDQIQGTYSDGRYDLVLLWCGRALSPAEVTSLSVNPWQIFAPPAPYWMAKRTFPCWLNYDEDR